MAETSLLTFPLPPPPPPPPLLFTSSLSFLALRHNSRHLRALSAKPVINPKIATTRLQQRAFCASGDGAQSTRTPPLERLPVLVHDGNLESQLAWDGECVRIIGRKRGKVLVFAVENAGVRWEEFLGRMADTFRCMLIPENVRPSYVPYMRWKFLHRVLSSILHVHSTQAMLRAIGIGAQRALPSAAALNWVLKDGLGRFGKLFYVARLGRTFDSDIKGVRFTTSVLFSFSLGLEMLTPFFPHHFLSMATLANIGKSISLAAYISTSSAILKSFALGDNLADIAAKGQVQAVVSDNLGLAIAVAISKVYKNIPRLESIIPLWIFPFMGLLELFAIFKELESVHFLTLNKVRLEIIIQIWLLKGIVPSAEEVSKYESRSLLTGADGKGVNLRLGTPTHIALKRDQLMALLNQQKNHQYLLFKNCDHCTWNVPWCCPKISLHLWLHSKASSTDIIKGVLQASYIRTVLWPSDLRRKDSKLCSARMQEEACHQTLNFERSAVLIEQNVKTSDEDFLNFVDESRQFAEENLQPLLDKMKGAGWLVKHILLKPHERCTYSIGDP